MPAVLLLIALSAPAPAPASPGPGLTAYAGGCITSLREFAYELSSAVEAGDVNRLAALYRWRGTSTRAGYSVMSRLQVLARRPLLGIDPVYPRPPRPPALPAAQAGAERPAYAAFPPEGAPGFEPAWPEPERRGLPVGLRLEQTLEDGTTAAPTTLWLRRELGCWWFTL